MKILVLFLSLFTQPGLPVNNEHFFSEIRQEQVITMRISDRLVDCDGVNGRDRCYQFQQGDKIGTDKWETLKYDIQNFRFEAGYEYDLLVRLVPLVNGSGQTEGHLYELVEILSRTKKD
jgi:hypothetical protein